MDFRFSKHAREMLFERMIEEEWVQRALREPKQKMAKDDGNIHYFKNIPERQGRILHVIVNPISEPQTVVTVFFDRGIRREK